MSEVQDFVNGQMEDRVTQAAMQLKNKYSNGKPTSTETSVTGPTGSAYKEQALQEKLVAKAIKEANRHDIISGGNHHLSSTKKNQDDEDDELRQLRDARKQKIYAEHQERLENVSKGHGRYRDIGQDEFLAEVTSSKFVICHFYHSDFSRCTIMDHHLNILAQRHLEAKFIKVNAEKAPFFVEKLVIRTIPTVVLFEDGKAVDKIIGFIGLADAMPEGKEDEWKTPVLGHLLASKGILKKELVENNEAETQLKLAKLENLRNKITRSTVEQWDDLDFSLDD